MGEAPTNGEKSEDTKEKNQKIKKKNQPKPNPNRKQDTTPQKRRATSGRRSAPNTEICETPEEPNRLWINVSCTLLIPDQVLNGT